MKITIDIGYIYFWTKNIDANKGQQKLNIQGVRGRIRIFVTAWGQQTLMGDLESSDLNFCYRLRQKFFTGDLESSDPSFWHHFRPTNSDGRFRIIRSEFVALLEVNNFLQETWNHQIWILSTVWAQQTLTGDLESSNLNLWLRFRPTNSWGRLWRSSLIQVEIRYINFCT